MSEEDCEPHASACVLIIQNDLVLVVWNKKHKCYGLPGGKRKAHPMNRAEWEPIRHTAVRELAEETDLEPVPGHYIHMLGLPHY